jgi:signal transduction histidine kinase
MRPHLAIRTRFALMSAALAIGVLTAGMVTVYLIERQQVQQSLRAAAHTAATDLARAGERQDSRRSASSSQTGPPASTAPPATGSTEDGGATTSSGTTPGGGATTSGGTTTWTPPASTGDGTRTEREDRGSSSGTAADGNHLTGVAEDSSVAIAAEDTGGGPPEADDDAVRSYLKARGTSEQLLATISPDGTVLANTRLARHLATSPLPAPGGVRMISVEGARYELAVAKRGSGLVVAAVPTAAADASIHRLLMAMLIVFAIGLVPATMIAWLAARRALSPLSRIAQDATRVTGGDLSVRMGPVDTHDEIAEVAVAIDAMLDRLEAAFEAQRRFVHDASHELRTPLTIARGHLEVALPPGADPGVREAVEVAIGEIDRMGRLVDSLLRLAREGHGDAATDPLDLGALASGVVERSQVLADRVWQVDAEPGLIVAGDQDALEQVLLNLLVNAVKHTAPGGSVAVRAARSDDLVRLEVTDDGEGIDPDILPRLFDRFVRADGSRGRDTGGTGLGLAICRSIVDEHGGRIWADNVDGGGARFVVELPAIRAGSMRAVSSPSHV